MLPDNLKDSPAAVALDARDSALVAGGRLDRGEVTLEIVPRHIVETCRFLRTEHEFERLVSVTAVDWYPREPRFEVVYHLHSMSRNVRMRLKCRLSGDDPAIDSVTAVWKGANWYEREVFDLFGIAFRNHPALTRIMMPENWQGHPLRKDFPIHGHKYSYQNE